MSTIATTQTRSVSDDITPPICINEKCHTQDIFTCNICCEMSLDPVVTPCDHIFCRDCIHKSLHRNKFCPNDRKPLRASQVQELCGPIKRVWSQIPVKCPECQIWTGSLQAYIAEHTSSCVNPQKRIQELEEKLKQAETELRVKTNQMQEHIHTLERQLNVALEAQRNMASQMNCAPQVLHEGDSQNQGKRCYESSPDRYFSSVTGPFGPFGTQQQQQQPPQHAQPNINSFQSNPMFGQSNTIWATPSSNQPFGVNNAATAARASNWISPSDGSVCTVNVQFQIGIEGREGRRIVRARRP